MGRSALGDSVEIAMGGTQGGLLETAARLTLVTACLSHVRRACNVTHVFFSVYGKGGKSG